MWKETTLEETIAAVARGILQPDWIYRKQTDHQGGAPVKGAEMQADTPKLPKTTFAN
jgi:hypothetical protein